MTTLRAILRSLRPSTGTKTTASKASKVGASAKAGTAAGAPPATGRPTPPGETLPPPPVCPPGWTVGPPDFVILGAQKAGTTWWFRLIEQHPRVVQPADQRPELHVFDRLTDRWPTADELAAYQRYFPRPAGSVAGEKTPEYLDSPWAVPMLAEAAPETRMIILLRDPITRYLSGRFHAERALTRTGVDPATRSLADRRRVVAEAIDKGLYATQLERVLAVHPAERVLVLQYEQCVRDPRGQLARTYAFLGLEPFEPTDEEIARPRNESRGSPVTISDEHRAVLRRLYRPEVQRLRTLMPDLDLSLWPDYADLA
jgi:hypothetical protein